MLNVPLLHKHSCFTDQECTLLRAQQNSIWRVLCCLSTSPDLLTGSWRDCQSCSCLTIPFAQARHKTNGHVTFSHQYSGQTRPQGIMRSCQFWLLLLNVCSLQELSINKPLRCYWVRKWHLFGSLFLRSPPRREEHLWCLRPLIIQLFVELVLHLFECK